MSSKNLKKIADRNLPVNESLACLSPFYLDLYWSLGAAMFEIVQAEDSQGWYLLVPLSKLQVEQIESGAILSGFAIAEGHFKSGLPLDPAGFYLMGIYGDKPARAELNKRWNVTAGKVCLPIYAKGTTVRGRRWMLRDGFMPIVNNPVIQVRKAGSFN